MEDEDLVKGKLVISYDVLSFESKFQRLFSILIFGGRSLVYCMSCFTSNLNSVNWDAHGPNLCIMAGHNYNPTFNTKIGNTFDWNLLKGKIEEIHNSRKQITNSLQDIYDYYSGGMYVS